MQKFKKMRQQKTYTEQDKKYGYVIQKIGKYLSYSENLNLNFNPKLINQVYLILKS